MIYLCICGKHKNGSPFHSAATKKWVCSSACAKRWAEKDKKPATKRKLFPNADQALVKVFSVSLCLLMLAGTCVAKTYRTVKQPRQPLAIPHNVDPPRLVKVMAVVSALEAVPIIEVNSSQLPPAVIPAKASQVYVAMGIGLALAVTISGGIFLYSRRIKNYGFHNKYRYAQLLAASHYRRAGQEHFNRAGKGDQQPSVLPQYLEPSSRGSQQRRHGGHLQEVRPRLADDAIVWEWARNLPA